MTTAERLKDLREKYQLSQHDVAKILKVSPSLISSYERNERMPSPAKLISLADLYHTSTDYLLCRNRITEELSLSVEGLSQKQIKLLRELIDTMKK